MTAAHNIGCRVGLKTKAAGPDEDAGEIIVEPRKDPRMRRRNQPCSANEMNDALQVERLREKIDQMHLFNPVARAEKNKQVPSQRHRIA